MFRAVQNALLSVVYPQPCRVCASDVESLTDGVACRQCWAATRIFRGTELLCDKCGAFFGDEISPVHVFCHKCDDHYYDNAAAVGIYEKALAASIIHLKSRPVLAGRLKAAVSEAFGRSRFLDAELIIPIPLSRQRKLERGFNQAEIVARLVARASGIRVDASSLGRRLHTPIHRIGMDKRARELTVKNAFEVVRPKLVDGKRILLVDDVFTSGATASACARILKKRGVVSVNVFTLARAVMH